MMPKRFQPAVAAAALLLAAACSDSANAPGDGGTAGPTLPSPTATPAPTPDPDDHGNSAAQGTPLAGGGFVPGLLETASDLDVFRLAPLISRARYRLTVEARTASPLKVLLRGGDSYERQLDLAEDGAVAALEFSADFGTLALVSVYSPRGDTGGYALWLELIRSAEQAEAYRLLRQASFGPTPAELDWVLAHGAQAWVERQLLAGSAYQSDDDGRLSQLQRMIASATALEPQADWFPTDPENPNAPDEPYFNGEATRHAADYQMSAWFQAALESSDQLRQRMAYALSQILVVSTDNDQLSRRPEAVAHYADILARNALGSFRTLLGEVARSPAMGFYLSHQGNEKANAQRNTLPDENFARELMQLFSIGLYQLQPDGQPLRDASGALIPSYDQQDIEEMSRVMTGWDLRYNSSYGRGDGSHVDFMEFNPDFHDYGEKRVLGQIIANGLPSGQDLEAALDLLFQHPNTAPFISRQLIQRLVTANPTPAYVGRVAAVFTDNGRGERGDLAAVARAILLDDEARGPAPSPAFGKIDEQLLGLTRWLRAFGVRPVPGWRLASEFGGEEGVYDTYWIGAHAAVGQGAFRAQHVFNFYDPDFVPQDAFYQDAVPQRVLPELQIKTPNNIAGVVSASNAQLGILERQWILNAYPGVQDFVAETNASGPDGAPGWARYPSLALLDYGPALAALEAGGIAGLLDDLEHRLLGDVPLGAAYRQQLEQELANAAFFQLGEGREQALRICSAAIQYLLLTPEYWVLN